MDWPASKMKPVSAVRLGTLPITMAALFVAGALIVTDRTTGLLGNCWGCRLWRWSLGKR